MEAKVRFFEGNLFSGQETDGIDIAAVSARYREQVEQRVKEWEPDVAIEWDVQPGEGPNCIVVATDDYAIDNRIQDAIQTAESHVWDDQRFWN